MPRWAEDLPAEWEDQSRLFRSGLIRLLQRHRI